MEQSYICDTYEQRFGRAGDFDRWLLPTALNLRLMLTAIKRGRPVTRSDMRRVHLDYYGVPLVDAPENPEALT